MDVARRGTLKEQMDTIDDLSQYRSDSEDIKHVEETAELERVDLYK